MYIEYIDNNGKAQLVRISGDDNSVEPLKIDGLDGIKVAGMTEVCDGKLACVCGDDRNSLTIILFGSEYETINFFNN